MTDQDFIQSFEYNRKFENPKDEIAILKLSIEMKDAKIRELINAGEAMVNSAKENLKERIIDAIGEIK